MRFQVRIYVAVLIGICLCQSTNLIAQFIPQSYTIPQATVINNGNGTQTVTYSWSPLAPTVTTVFLLYSPLGAPAWSTVSVGGTASPQTASIPVGTYQYAIGLNSVTNVVLMNGTIPAPDYNYIRSWTATAPEQSATNLITRPLTDEKQSTQYFDGLGRLLQTVAKQASPLGNDEVTAKYYDAMGRDQTYTFLPFVSNALANSADVPNDGNFKPDPYQQQASFYNTGNTNSPIKGQAENYFYSQSVYDNSPLDRVTSTFAPGNSWVGSAGSGNPKPIQTNYLTNNATDNVFVFNTAWATSPPPLEVLVNNNGNNTQIVTYNWAPLGPNAVSVWMLYRVVGTSTWTTGNVGGAAGPRSATMPVGTYEYAIEVIYSTGSPQTFPGIVAVGNPALVTSVTPNGDGTQTVTYSWNSVTNVGTVLLLYSPLGVSPTWIDASGGSPISPRTANVPVGNFQYAIELFSNNGGPAQIVESASTSTASYNSTGSYAPGTLTKKV